MPSMHLSSLLRRENKEPQTHLQTIHVVSQDDIAARGYSSLIELLDDIPSVEIQRNSMNEFKNVVGLRGISGNEKFVIMMDGIRITPATGDPYTLAKNFSLLNAKRVEVILGPASALYGVDAFSGIINIITQEGSEIDGVELSSSYGLYNTLENSFIGGGELGGINFSVAGQLHSSDEPDYQNLFPEEYAWFRDVYLPTGQMGAPGSDTTIVTDPSRPRQFEMPYEAYFLSAKANFGNFEIGATRHHDRHSSSLSVDPKAAIYNNDAFLSTTMQTSYLRHIYTRQISKNRIWSLQSLVSLSDFTMDPTSKYLNFFTGYGEGYKYQFSRSQKIEEQLDIEFNSRWSLIGGLSYELLNSLPKTSDTPSPVDENIPADNQELYYSGSILSNDSTGIPLDFYYLNYWNFGSYAQLQYKPSSLLELTLGSRYDYNSRYAGSLNPRLGIVLKPSGKMKIKLLFGQAFLAPSPWKAFTSFGSFKEQIVNGAPTLAADFFHLPNSDLKPEKLNSLEGSFTWLPDDHTRVVLGGYFNHINDLISLQEQDVTINTFKGVPVGFIETSQNQGESTTYGLSIHSSLRLLKTPNARINYYAAYDFSDGYISILQSDGSFVERDLTLSARHTVKSGLDFNYHNLSGSIRMLYRSKSKSVKTLRPGNSSNLDASNNEDAHKGFSVVNLHLRYQLSEGRRTRWSCFVKVNNVLNSKYYNVTGATDSFSATPQDPIRVQGGVNFKIY